MGQKLKSTSLPPSSHPLSRSKRGACWSGGGTALLGGLDSNGRQGQRAVLLPSEVRQLRPPAALRSRVPAALLRGEGRSVPTARTVCQGALRGARGAGLREQTDATGPFLPSQLTNLTSKTKTVCGISRFRNKHHPSMSKHGVVTFYF